MSGSLQSFIVGFFRTDLSFGDDIFLLFVLAVRMSELDRTDMAL